LRRVINLDEVEKWREILRLEIMSSDDSGVDEDEDKDNISSTAIVDSTCAV
jgi:hypothetical protein